MKHPPPCPKDMVHGLIVPFLFLLSEVEARENDSHSYVMLCALETYQFIKNVNSFKKYLFILKQITKIKD